MGGEVLEHLGAEIERTEKKLEFADNFQKESMLRGISGQRINVSSGLFMRYSNIVSIDGAFWADLTGRTTNTFENLKHLELQDQGSVIPDSSR